MSAKHYYIDTKYQNLLKELDLWNLDGRNFGQRGNRVSGGEKNKIALARFLLPEYGEYFILDEPFTSLDAISEKKCFEVLKRYTKEMKGIIISHKMNIISQFSDVICVVENGVITDQGTHDTLINESELYKKLCDEYEKKTKKEELF